MFIHNKRKLIIFLILLTNNYCLCYYSFGSDKVKNETTGAIELTDTNFNETLKSYDIVVVNFYVHWCQHSQELLPIFDDVANKISSIFNNSNKIILGKINLFKQRKVQQIYEINQYPLIKTFYNNRISYDEYEGPRTTSGLLRYVINQILNPIIEIESTENLEPKLNNTLVTDKSIILGYFKKRNQKIFSLFERLARFFKTTFEFRVNFNDTQSIENGLLRCWTKRNDFNETQSTLNDEQSNYKGIIKWIRHFCQQ